MGFFSRNKKESSQNENKVPENIELPELPSLPSIQELRAREENSENSDKMNKNYSLPSLPSSKLGDKMNKTMIKDTVKDDSNKEIMGGYEEDYEIPSSKIYPPMFQKPRAVEYDSFKSNQKKMQGMPKKEAFIPSNFPKNTSKSFEMSNPPIMNQRYQNYEEPPQRYSDNSRGKEPIFVKLDKFESTVSGFNEIKLRISEIESLLRNIKEIKMKEEHELNTWEREIETVKTRLESIEKDLFKDIQ